MKLVAICRRGSFINTNFILISKFLLSNNQQGWSSWLWHLVNTENVEGSNPSLCIHEFLFGYKIQALIYSSYRPSAPLITDPDIRMTYQTIAANITEFALQ